MLQSFLSIAVLPLVIACPPVAQADYLQEQERALAEHRRESTRIEGEAAKIRTEIDRKHRERCEKSVEDDKRRVNEALLAKKKPLPKANPSLEIASRSHKFTSAAYLISLTIQRCVEDDGDYPVLKELLEICDRNVAALDAEREKFITPLPNLVDEELGK